MSKEYWSGVLNTTRQRLNALRLKRDELDAQREEVNNEVVQLEQLITTLSPLAEEPFLDHTSLIKDVDKLSLADACRRVLQNSNKFMTPIEVRNTLDVSGYDLSQHSNPLASIHGVLKRLAESGEVETIFHEVRGTMYRWKIQGTPWPHQSAGGSPVTWDEAIIEAERKDIEQSKKR